MSAPFKQKNVLSLHQIGVQSGNVSKTFSLSLYCKHRLSGLRSKF